AYATRTREGGEETLVLGWQERVTSELVRGYLIALDFFQAGVKAFIVTDAMPRKQFLRETVVKLRADEMPTMPITWAQARRLVQEALAVNAWRRTEPAAAFVEHRAQIDERLLGEPHDDEQRTAIVAEEARAAREGDRPLIAPDQEADETV